MIETKLFTCPEVNKTAIFGIAVDPDTAAGILAGYCTDCKKWEDVGGLALHFIGKKIEPVTNESLQKDLELFSSTFFTLVELTGKDFSPPSHQHASD